VLAVAVLVLAMMAEGRQVASMGEWVATAPASLLIALGRGPTAGPSAASD
jgi:hypothetical protein